MQMKYDFAEFENIIPKLGKKAFLKVELLLAHETYFMIKVVCFQKN